jgi:cbb3-type cytochrome oxidase subunit 3
MNFIFEHAPSMSLIFFFSIFLAVAYRAYRPSMKSRMEAHALIPFVEEHNND